MQGQGSVGYLGEEGSDYCTYWCDPRWPEPWREQGSRHVLRQHKERGGSSGRKCKVGPERAASFARWWGGVQSAGTQGKLIPNRRIRHINQTVCSRQLVPVVHRGSNRRHAMACCSITRPANRARELREDRCKPSGAHCTVMHPCADAHRRRRPERVPTHPLEQTEWGVPAPLKQGQDKVYRDWQWAPPPQNIPFALAMITGCIRQPLDRNLVVSVLVPVQSRDRAFKSQRRSSVGCFEYCRAC